MPATNTSNHFMQGSGLPHPFHRVLDHTPPILLTILLTSALILLPPLTQSFSQTNPSPTESLTADELISSADQAFNQRKFSEAANLYEKFIAQFSQSQESQIQEAIRRRRHTVAMCHVQDRKFPQAIEAIQTALSTKPPLDVHQTQELSFWLGVALLDQKDYEQSRSSLLNFIALFPPANLTNPNYLRQFPMTNRIPEAKLLAASALLLSEKFTEAATELASIKDTLPVDARGRAVVLELLALLEASQLDEALSLLRREFPRMAQIPQLISFQLLALRLGSELLDQGRLREAIAALQRIWLSDRLLRHQKERLTDAETRLAAESASPRPDTYKTLQLQQLITSLRREITEFTKIPHFDSAIRLRLARAYLDLERYRESALIMDGMLEELPPDEIVESASITLVQTWSTIQRWDKAISAAAKFEETFPQSSKLPTVIYLRGVAEQNQQNYDDSIATFQRLVNDFPDTDLAPRALFMSAFTMLLAEQNPQAIKTFDTFLTRHPTHELADSAEYWKAMGLSLNKQFSEARDAFSTYLANRKTSATHREAAIFRIAYCSQQLRDYEKSIPQLKDYLRLFPQGEFTAEAHTLIADALMANGLLEEGIQELAKIPPANHRFYEEGVFKTAKALRLLEQTDRLLQHLQKFISTFPQSPRVAEAIIEISRVHREAGRLDLALQTCWDAIEKYGNDASIRSIDDLFPLLIKLSQDHKNQKRLLAQLRDLTSTSPIKKNITMRSLWAQALALRKSNPDAARKLLIQAADLADPRSTNPALLADFALAFQETGNTEKAQTLYSDLIKWHPRAPQKDQALATLAFLSLQKGDEPAAIKFLSRFAREVESSPLRSKVLLQLANLQAARGLHTEAIATLNSVLENRLSTGPQKAEALFRIAELHLLDDKPALAIPFLQRIYVMHSRWRDWTAKAYLLSGQAFEKLNDTTSARKTYQELIENDDLSPLPEFQIARDRLQALGGPIPKNPQSTPEPSPAG